MVYALAILGTLFGVSSLAIDFGRVQVARTEARNAATAAARYGAMMLPNGSNAAIAGAINSARENKIDGQPLELNAAQDVEVGYWDTNTRTFTKNVANPNAVRVIARRTTKRGNPVPTIFARAIGLANIDINEDAIAMLKPTVKITYDIPATASPYLAGMPIGTKSSLNHPNMGIPGRRPDIAGQESPIDATGLGIKPGEALTFNNIAGGANNDISWDERFMPDGNLSWMTGNDTQVNGGELGKSNMYAPINALVGVFLSDQDPRNMPLPETLDFRSDASRDFAELRPKLNQVFFIGDGKRSNGEPQRFIVPEGATRFYLANWDGYEWNNNVGMRTTEAIRIGGVVTVK